MGENWKTVDEAAGIWLAEYPFNGTTINTVAMRIADDKLMVLSPGTDVSDASFAELDALGEVAAIVSPGPFHHLGMPGWKARYPNARLFATAGGLTRIPKQHKGVELGLEGIDALQPLLPDSVVAIEMPDQKHADLFIVVTGEGSTTWYTNECLGNQSELPPNFVLRTLFKWTKSGPGLRVNSLALKLIGGKKPSLAAFFAEQMKVHPPTRLVPCHGSVLEGPDTAAQLQAEFDRAF
jgi:hypothetical protein